MGLPTAAVITEGNWDADPGFSVEIDFHGRRVVTRVVEAEGVRFLYFPHAGKRAGIAPPDAGRHVFELLASVGVRTVLYYALAGSVNTLLRPGDIMIPDDLIDMTRHRPRSLLEDSSKGLVLYYRADRLFCRRLSSALVTASRSVVDANVFDSGVCIVTEGPRFETAAEIRAYRQWGGDACCHNLVPEALLARECGMCFAAVVGIANYGEGVVPVNVSPPPYSVVEQLLTEAFPRILSRATPYLLSGDCECSDEEHWIMRPTVRRDGA